MPKSSHTRRRGLEQELKLQQRHVRQNGSLVSLPEAQARPTIMGRQITTSEGHHWPPPKGAKGDFGGDFFTSKSYLKSPRYIPTSGAGGGGAPGPPDFGSSVNSAATFAIGVPGSAQMSWPPSLESSTAQLIALGTQAIKRCEPTNSPADVMTFLGELLKDGIPKLLAKENWQRQTDLARKGSSEYLGVQFGVLPFVRDIRSFADAIQNADKVLAQYERDAGRLVRRTYRFPSQTESTTTLVSSTHFPWGFVSGFRAQVGSLWVTRKVTRERWFKGAFTYYLPSGYDSRNGMESAALKAQFLLGAKLTPETLWNIAPWSWAVDWFTNTGDVISNISKFATGGLVMPYGYMMEHTIVEETYTLKGATSYERQPLELDPMVLVTETKKRVQANPFGFGITWDGLSPFQASILAALGISRGGRR